MYCWMDYYTRGEWVFLMGGQVGLCLASVSMGWALLTHKNCMNPTCFGHPFVWQKHVGFLARFQFMSVYMYIQQPGFFEPGHVHVHLNRPIQMCEVASFGHNLVECMNMS